jgi:hypothetical protein
MSVEKEEKPKKAFVVVHTVWDDGEVDSELYEFRKNPSGRGAPGKWRLKPVEFVNRVGETLGDAATLVEEMTQNTGVSSAEIEVQEAAAASAASAGVQHEKVEVKAPGKTSKKDKKATDNATDKDLPSADGIDLNDDDFK